MSVALTLTPAPLPHAGEGRFEATRERGLLTPAPLPYAGEKRFVAQQAPEGPR